MSNHLDLHFSSDHPTRSGHFPGNPIIPGATLLDEVVQAIGRPPRHVRSAKFLRPVRPGDTVQLNWDPQATGEIKFTCQLAGELVLTGSLQ